MSELQQLPPRPAPPRRPGDLVRRWLAWFGVGRMVLTAVSVLAVCAGLLWLVRTEPPPAEASLPIASAAPPPATLPPPGPVPTGSAPANDLVVHVAGAVRTAGVYRLDAGARVDEAVRAAGGPLGDADLDGLNLAAVLVDGQRVYVPRGGEVDPATVPSGATPDAAAAPTGPLDRNTATIEQLEGLPGVGPARG